MTSQPNPLTRPAPQGPDHPYANPGPALAAALQDPDPDSQSVAGEEDPGASLDLFSGAAAGSGGPVSIPENILSPGDEAPAGTPGTGESICRECGGSGRAGDAVCPSCQGSGKVVVGVGGA